MYEGYSQSEAEYATYQIQADWIDQAVKKAKLYLELMPFSQEKLIEQLKFDGFEEVEANIGAAAALGVIDY